MQKVEQSFNPELALISLSATTPRTKTFYAPSSRTKRFPNLNEFQWPIVVVKIAKLILTHAIRLAMRAGNIVIRHFQPGSFHLKNWTGVYDVMTSKVPDFGHPRKFIKRVRSKKSTLDSGFKKRRFRCADITRPNRTKKSALSKVQGFLVDGAEWRPLCF